MRGDFVPLTTALNIDFVHRGDGYRVWAYFPAPATNPSSLTLVSPEGDGAVGWHFGGRECHRADTRP